jgi:hypothetical protein
MVMSKLILQIEGGVGKNILATAVVRSLNNKYPNHKIIIVTAHKDIWLCNPRIHRIYEFNNLGYFYQDHVENQDTEIFAQDPYRHNDYILGNKHIVDVWCDMCGVESDGHKPELYFTKLESDFLQTSLLVDERPIFIINAFGGSETQQHKYSWMRDIPPSTAQAVVDHYKNDYRIIQIRRSDQIELDGVESLSLNPRELCLALIHSKKRLLIDSFLQHASAAIGLESVVLWIGNSPNTLGHDTNTNVISNNLQVGDIHQSFYHKFDILGNPIQLASDPHELFDNNEIIKLFEN